MNRKTQTQKIKVLLLFYFFMPLFLYAQTLTFVTIELEPYAYKHNNKVQGIAIDILNTIFSRMNIKVDYQIVPWARAVSMVKHGEVDGIFPFLKNPQRENFTDYAKAFISEPFAMYIHKNAVIHYDGTLESLSEYTFGRVRGYSSGEFFDEAVENCIVQMEYANNSAQNLEKFFKHRFQILVDNKYYILSQLKHKNRVNDFVQLGDLLSNEPSFLGFSKKRNHKKIITEFNKVLKEIKDDGTYDDLVHQYF